MQIRRLQINGLFGELDHPITLRSGLTFLFAPNGAGKTTSLQIVDDLFNKRFATLADRPFEKLEVTFADDSSLLVERRPKSRPSTRSRHRMNVLQFSSSTQKKPWVLDPDEMLAGFPLNAVEEIDSDLRRVGPTRWRDRTTDRDLDLDDIQDRFGRFWGPGGPSGLKPPAWLTEILDSVPVYFIGAQRIASPGHSVDKSRPGHKARSHDPVTVVEFAAEMAKKVQASLADYAEYSQDLDSKFPDLLLNTTADALPPTQSEIEERYDTQNARRNRYIQTGLLEPGDRQVEIHDDLAEYQLRVLDAHMRDIDRKFDRLDSIASRLELFLQIVNSKFRRKRIVVDKTSGIRAIGDDKSPIDLVSLSSGEQQEIVLAYRLLFQETAGTLVLVDEPEISLHVTWQLDLIPDLLRISELADLEFLVATHSPQVINDRDDLVVFLSDGVK